MKVIVGSLLLSLIANIVALAQSPGEFTATGSMHIARFRHTATLLMNGKVLIAGGRSSGSIGPTASAELYDPATGAVTPTGDMTTPRSSHTATLLPDGTVLILGGLYGGSLGLMPELYDPETGSFHALENSVAGADTAFCTSAALLNSGKVLVTIGTWWPGPKVIGVPSELYDPSGSQFAPAGMSITNHSYEWTCPLATPLAGGGVLVTWEDPDAEVYRPGEGSFAPAGNMLVGDGYQNYSATLLNNGMVLIAGATDFGVIGSAELYDPTAGRFMATGNLNQPRSAHTSTLLPDGTVLLTGGWGPNSTTFGDAELYDARSGTFSGTGRMTAARFRHTATLLADGTVLLAGGAYGPNNPLVVASTELYHPASVIPAPKLLSITGDQQGAILHAGTARLVTPEDPAVPGEPVEIYATGLNAGSVIPPRVVIGGRLAEILYFDDAPGFQGLNQVNVRVPVGVIPGSAVPVRLTYLGRPTNAVAIGIQ
jgi:hypothetical protein